MNTTQERAHLKNLLARDDMKAAVAPKQKTRRVTRYQVLQCNSVRESTRKLRRTYTRRAAQRAVRLLKRFGLEAWISPVSTTETR